MGGDGVEITSLTEWRLAVKLYMSDAIYGVFTEYFLDLPGQLLILFHIL